MRIPGAGMVASFEEGEKIFTESSYKYDEAALTAHVEAQGFRAEETWKDDTARYALFLFSAR